MVEIRGDEALVVFTSARQAIRTAVDLQKQFDEETELGERASDAGRHRDRLGRGRPARDGTFRGSALNVAARLCGQAHGGECSSARRRPGWRVTWRASRSRTAARAPQNIPEPVHILSVRSDEVAPTTGRWVFQSFGRPGQTLGWKLVAAIVGIAALTAAGVVYLTTNDRGDSGTAAPLTTPGGVTTLPADAGLDVLVPTKLWADCRLQTVPEPTAVETAVCLPPDGLPDRWEISMYADGTTLRAAYDGKLRVHDIERNSGRCTAFSWGGELQWLHGPGKPGGRIFCYFDGDDAVAVWTHGASVSRPIATSSSRRAKAGATTPT